MRRAFIILTLIIFSTGLEANEMNWKTLQLNIHDIDNTRGGQMSVYVFLKEGFPVKHQKSLQQYHFDVEQTSHTLNIQVPDQNFALKAHHDEDRSGSVTKNWTGIFPIEGFAFSSGAKIRFGPPSFSKAKMQYPDSGKADVHMIYP